MTAKERYRASVVAGFALIAEEARASAEACAAWGAAHADVAQAVPDPVQKAIIQTEAVRWRREMRREPWSGERVKKT